MLCKATAHSGVIIIGMLLLPCVEGGKERQWRGPSFFFEGRVPSPRTDHGFVGMGTKLYLFGGFDAHGLVLNDFHQFDLNLKEWTELSNMASGMPPSPRSGHVLVNLNGSLVVFGGVDQADVALNDMYSFDVLKIAWDDLSGSVSGEHPTPRADFGVATSEWKMYVFGGIDSDGNCLNDLHQFDAISKKWSTFAVVGTVPEPRWGLGLAILNNKLFLFGGEACAFQQDQETSYFGDFYSLDITTSQTLEWFHLENTSGTAPSPRSQLGFSCVNEKLYAHAGRFAEGDNSEMYEFDPAAMSWTNLTDQTYDTMPPPRFLFGQTALHDSIYIFGGMDIESLNSGLRTIRNDMYGFNLLDESYSWTDLNGLLHGPTQEPTYRPAMTCAGGKLYALAGKDENGDVLHHFIEYDITSFTWSNVPGSYGDEGAHVTIGFNYGIATIGQNVFFFQSYEIDGDPMELYEFNTSTATWTNLSQDMHGIAPSWRSYFFVAAVFDTMYVFGGYNNGIFLSDLYSLSVRTKAWVNLTDEMTGSIPTARCCFGFAEYLNELYVFGGNIDDYGTNVNDLLKFNPSTLDWIDLTHGYRGTPPSPRYHHGFAASGTKFFVFGGYSQGYLSDLYALDPKTLEWTDLTSMAKDFPSARYGHGFVWCENFLHSFGGIDTDGLSNELRSLATPKTLPWPAPSEEFSGFVHVFDWDVLQLQVVESALSRKLVLCTGVLPCAMTIIGQGTVLVRSSLGSIWCLADLGCKGLALQSVSLVCDSTASKYSLLKVQRCTLSISNCTFSACSSLSDGGIIQSYNSAVVRLESCTFQDLHTMGYGGAVSALGGSVHINEASFRNCSADEGGGAIWASSYQCAGQEAEQGEQTMLRIQKSSFVGCSSKGRGGAMRITSSSVWAEMLDSFISECSSLSGGAIAAESFAALLLHNSTLSNNVALGIGGGAFYAESAILKFSNLTCRGNQAPRGGGGVLFWDGSSQIDSRDTRWNLTDVQARSLMTDGMISTSANDFGHHLTNCSPDNSAVYGPCVATSYRYLAVSAMPKQIYPGISFDIVVTKIDAYNQTIGSDSTSVLFVQSALNGNVALTDPALLIAGTTVSQLQVGSARFSISLLPSYSNVSSDEGIAELASKPYIHFHGTDLQTFQNLKSQAFEVHLSERHELCPIGFILSLGTLSSKSRLGTCRKCPFRTYSINPLAGKSMDEPSCFDCPAGGHCEGGSNVTFAKGIWQALRGSFKLVGCPTGHQLIDSFNGVFRQDLQECRQCKTNEYVLESNNSTFSCQPCPSGASCNGSDLSGLVKGSVWTVDIAKGQYVLTSCPGGYSLENLLQACIVCPSGYFCSGGSTSKILCPVGSFTLPGANSSTACAPAVFVRSSISLQMSRAELVSVQSRFLEAVAATVDMSLERIVLESIIRRDSSDSALVDLKFAAPDMDHANDLSRKFNSESVSIQLRARGLPAGAVISVKVISDIESTSSTRAETAIIAGIIVGFVALLCISFLMYFLLRHYMRQSAHKALLASFAKIEPGSEANANKLPLKLQSNYDAKTILGKGVSGYVVHAKIKSSDQNVAIKLKFPAAGNRFNDVEFRQLEREKAVLELLTKQKNIHAVNLPGFHTVNVRNRVSWFVMEYLNGESLDVVVREGPSSYMECIKVARNVLAALKAIHAEGLVHRNITPSNIVRTLISNPSSSSPSSSGAANHIYKLVGFGSVSSVGEPDEMNRTESLSKPYMSPEMYTNHGTAGFPTDFWSLGVTLFELATGKHPFLTGNHDDSSSWTQLIVDLERKAPNVLDTLDSSNRSLFDNNLSIVVAKALEKRVDERYATVDEMHDDIYMCLIEKGEATYSVFISYRVASEGPLARILFDELNHTVTPGGHRVTVYLDAFRLVKGENWEEGFSSGLLNSLCFFPLLSYGSTAPLAQISERHHAQTIALGWEASPFDRPRLQGTEFDVEDNVLKEFAIATALLERNYSDSKGIGEMGKVQVIYPILVGRQHPPGHPKYPRMGDFFQVQGGGGQYIKTPSPPTNRSVSKFLREKVKLSSDLVSKAEERSVNSIMQEITRLQGCQLWKIPSELQGLELTREQKQLVGSGFVGPAVDLPCDGSIVELSDEQVKACRAGFDEAQLRMLKAQVRAKLPDFHEVIDRAIAMSAASNAFDGPVNVNNWEDRIRTSRRALFAASRGDLVHGGNSDRV